VASRLLGAALGQVTRWLDFARSIPLARGARGASKEWSGPLMALECVLGEFLKLLGLCPRAAADGAHATFRHAKIPIDVQGNSSRPNPRPGLA
jgi:hypothetical protein